MTDTELTKMLRSSANRVVNYAADRIEALTARAEAAEAERGRLREDLEELDFLRHEGGPDSVAAIEAERDRLREALESLHGFADGWRECGCGDSCYGRHAERNMVLDHLHDFARAALKGESQ